jgi:hypothetical protein
MSLSGLAACTHQIAGCQQVASAVNVNISIYVAGMHGIREDWTVDLLACTYHAGKFAIWGAVEGIIIAICVLGIREAVAGLQHRVDVVLQ